MSFRIKAYRNHNRLEIIDIWEKSVRATHHFLKKEDIDFFKTLVLEFEFDESNLFCLENTENEIIGFMGIIDRKLEMLFLKPDYIGLGAGKFLMNYALNYLGVKKVDVNEDNKTALKFYQKFGFEIIQRNEFDSSGKPYPILELALTKNSL